MDLQFLQALLGTAVDKAKKFDYRRLIPRAHVEKYAFAVVGIELTSPWSKEGFGLGLGLGVLDLWVGWPRPQENLHTENCKHGVQVEEKQLSLVD